VSYHRP